MKDKYLVERVGDSYCVIDADTGEVVSDSFESQYDAFVDFVMPRIVPKIRQCHWELKVDGFARYSREKYMCPRRNGRFGIVTSGPDGCESCPYCSAFICCAGRRGGVKVHCTHPVVCRTPDEFPPVQPGYALGPCPVTYED